MQQRPADGLPSSRRWRPLSERRPHHPLRPPSLCLPMFGLPCCRDILDICGTVSTTYHKLESLYSDLTQVARYANAVSV